MSATAFQRRRREIEQKESKVDYDSMKVADLKLLCEEKGIEYDAKEKKDDLIKLLKGAE